MKNQVELNAFHQGDVQGKRVVSLPADAKRTENAPLAYGEVSGHCHALTGDVEMFELDGVRYAVVGTDGACLQHVHVREWEKCGGKRIAGRADHGHVDLPAGTYAFGIQQEYDPYEGVFRNSFD